MSNAMRMGKRTLAGVAAGALGLALVPALSVTSAQATGTGAATVSPVRVTFTGTAKDIVEPATMTAPSTWSSSNDYGFSFDLETAPPGAVLTIGDALGASTGVALTGASGVLVADDTLSVLASAAGTYTGYFGNGTDTATFNFTTSGNPASLELTPANFTVPEGGNHNYTVRLLDGSGNQTQPTIYDTVALTASANGSPSSTTLSGNAFNGANDFSSGKLIKNISITTGSSTIKATPAGTLPSYGVTAVTATLTASGSVQGSGVKDLSVSSPANAANAGSLPSWWTQVPANTTSLTIDVDDDTGTAGSTVGNTVRFALGAGTGTINGTVATDDSVYVDVTIGADGTATIPVTLGAGAQAAGQWLTISQVGADNSTTLGDGTSRTLTVYQIQPAVLDAGVTCSPDGSVVAKVGDSYTVTASVDDSFGVAQQGFTVTAYVATSTTSANFVTSGTTDANGEVQLTLAPLTAKTDGQSQTFYIQAVSPLGVKNPASAAQSCITVEYTDSGDVTSLTVTPNYGTPCTAGSTCTVTQIPAIRPPYQGSVFAADSTAESQAVYNVATDDTSGSPWTTWAEIVPSTTPSNAVTITTPEGVYVSDTAPSASKPILANAGTNTATVTSGSAAYIWGTKTGTHEITFTSGTLSQKMKVVIANSAWNAYNIGISPAEQTLGAGAFGTATVSVSDVFGNPVKTSGNWGKVAIAADGAVRLGGYQTSQEVNTDAAGKAVVTLIADAQAGTGSVTATPTTDAALATPSWVSGFDPVTGFPAPVTSAAATVTVTSAPTSKTITIVGERGTVKGKPGIMVDGVTTGFAEGDLMVPYIKFPGQTSYSEGTARPAVDAEGEFYWQRKTGKKIYVYFKNEDGTVKSDRIIIQAK